jgi:threonine synthase
MSQSSQFQIDPLMDGGIPASAPLSREVLELSALVRNHKKSLVDRLESYEDIISIEIGDTPLSRMRSVERETGLRQLYIKFEGGNPSGTQKDRIAYAQCLDALRRKYDTITLATCGNFGAAVAQAAFLAGLRCIIYIPEEYHTDRIAEMVANGAEVFRFPGSYEDNVYQSQKEAEAHRWYDANPEVKTQVCKSTRMRR